MTSIEHLARNLEYLARTATSHSARDLDRWIPSAQVALQDGWDEIEEVMASQIRAFERPGSLLDRMYSAYDRAEHALDILRTARLMTGHDR